jgi:ribosomal protein L39E
MSASNGHEASSDQEPGFRPGRVSAKSARLPFQGCSPEYIANVCHGRCCDSSTQPSGTLIAVASGDEARRLRQRGAVIVDGQIQPRPGERVCPFKSGEGFCGLHFTPDKPFGCIASPFTLNANNTLIVRNRYKLLRCYKQEPQVPAYVAFRTSLEILFGPAEAARIVAHLDAGGGDLEALMIARAHRILADETAIRAAARDAAR